jgi:hypothetical protein
MGKFVLACKFAGKEIVKAMPKGTPKSLLPLPEDATIWNWVTKTGTYRWRRE